MRLSPSEARRAIVAPAERQQVSLTDEAIDLIFDKTLGYPYFLQEWASCSWDVAKSTPITKSDVELAGVDAINNLDVSFFRTRIEQLSPTQKRYLRAMAELGGGPQRTGDIAKVLGRTSSSVASIRDQLIRTSAAQTRSVHVRDSGFPSFFTSCLPRWLAT